MLKKKKVILKQICTFIFNVFIPSLSCTCLSTIRSLGTQIWKQIVLHNLLDFRFLSSYATGVNDELLGKQREGSKETRQSDAIRPPPLVYKQFALAGAQDKRIQVEIKVTQIVVCLPSMSCFEVWTLSRKNNSQI